MKVEIENVSDVRKKISVEVPADVVEKSVEKVMKKLQNEVKIPGFRQGKAPYAIIEKRLGSDMDIEIAREVMGDTYAEAVVNADFTPISDPSFEPGEYSKGKPYSYKVTFEVYPTINIEGFEGMQLECEKVDVAEAEVDNEIKALQQRLTQLEPVEDVAVGDGMVALIDYSGFVDGKKFEGSDGDGLVVDVGSGNTLVDFEKQILGLKKDEKKRVEIKYPSDYFNKELASKEAIFDVKVRDIKKKNVPAIDDEFAKSLGDFNSIDALKSDIRTKIEEIKNEWKKQKLYRQIMEGLVKKFPIEVPNVLVREELLAMYNGFIERLNQEGKKPEDAGVTIEGFVKENDNEAKTRVASYMLLRAVAEKENITVAPTDMDEFFQKYAVSMKQSAEQIRKDVEKNGKLHEVEGRLLFEKALEFVLGKSKVKEVKAKPNKIEKK